MDKSAENIQQLKETIIKGYHEEKVKATISLIELSGTSGWDFLRSLLLGDGQVVDSDNYTKWGIIEALGEIGGNMSKKLLKEALDLADKNAYIFGRTGLRCYIKEWIQSNLDSIASKEKYGKVDTDEIVNRICKEHNLEIIGRLKHGGGKIIKE